MTRQKKSVLMVGEYWYNRVFDFLFFLENKLTTGPGVEGHEESAGDFGVSVIIPGSSRSTIVPLSVESTDLAGEAGVS